MPIRVVVPDQHKQTKGSPPAWDSIIKALNKIAKEAAEQDKFEREKLDGKQVNADESSSVAQPPVAETPTTDDQ